ncbi:MAG: class I SAM-dependent rRNA methyltransferase, partial [Planctomycetota bacterium]
MKPHGQRRPPSRRAPREAPRPAAVDLSGPAGDPDTVVRLRARRGSPHPWIFRTMVAEREIPRDLLPGQIVKVVDKDGDTLGRAFWNPRSTIALRMITHDPGETVDAAFFERKIGEALRFRREVLGLEAVTDGYRIVHAEADGLSGLIVDRLGAVVAVEVFGVGFARHVRLVKEALTRLLPGVAVVARADARSGQIEGFDLPPEKSDPKTSEVQEHGLRFKVDLETGHKTGFFCDQRDNRALWGRLVKGRRVLDCHSYTGGFALHAAKGGAAEVTGVDLDEDAIVVAKKNANLNQLQGKVKFVHSDVFPYLRDAQRQEKKFDAISLDPPKLARDPSEAGEALHVYSDLNKVALETLAPDGLFLTCSCSGSISEPDFLNALRNAAARARRELQI